MRRSVLITLLAATPLVVSGCHHSTGPHATGQMTPLAPTTLSPLGAGQTPSLGPFGSPTRVAPPATGSHLAPNNYMGGIGAPGGQAGVGANVGGGFASRGDAIGSGVAVAGFQANAQPQNRATANGGPVNSTAPNDPRSGGMRVIDLTGAPPPPGYRGQPPASSPNTFRGQAQPNFVPQTFNSVPPNQGLQRSFQPVEIPSPGRIATAPQPTPMTEIPSNPAPIGSGASAPSNDLPWRRPGTF